MLVDHFCFWSWYLNQIFKVHICRFTFISPIMPTLKIIVASRALHENRPSWGWLCVDGNLEFLFIAFRTFNSTMMWLNLFTNLVNKSSKMLITSLRCLRCSSCLPEMFFINRNQQWLLIKTYYFREKLTCPTSNIFLNFSIKNSLNSGLME